MKSKILINGLIVAGALMFSGCTTSKNLTIYNDKDIKSEMTIMSYPKLNEISNAEIGINLYEKTKFYIHNTYDVSIGESINMYSVASGKVITSKKNLGILQVDNATGWKSGCFIPDNQPFIICLFDSNNDNKFDKIGSVINDLYTDLEKQITYSLRQTPPTYSADSFKYVALYQGKSANKIKISFREFKDDMARPAFTQDIEYQLSPNGTTTIGFKGLRINVIKATNVDITYSVVKDFN